jgi:predicted PurR-regulated permease PerM
MAETMPTRDLTRTTLAVLCLGGLLATTFWVLRPFLPALIWATMLAIASWPMLCRLQARFGNRRGAAVIAIMSVLLLVFVIPIALILGVLITRAPELVAWVHQLLQTGLPPPPAWVADLPMVGARIAAEWTELAASGPEGLAAKGEPLAQALAGWFVSQAGGVGVLLLHLLLTLVMAAVLFAKGDQFAVRVRQFARRLAGERGENVALLAARSVRAVAFGVVVTALVQSLVGGVGLVIAGVPLPGLLTAVMFVASIAQIGAAPVLAIAAIWLYCHDQTGWAIGMLCWTVVVGSLDNVIRPLLIKKGVDLPLLLVFGGVIGGLIAFGPVGLFAGPVVLATGHTLLSSWISEQNGSAAPARTAP